jgi:hypothetical protein
MCYIIIFGVFVINTYLCMLMLTPKFNDLIQHDDVMLMYKSYLIKK